MNFRNFNSKSDGLRFDFSTNKLKCSSYLSWTPLPESFEILLPESFKCLSDLQQSFGNPLRTFRQSSASPVLTKSRFFLQQRHFRSLYAGTSRVPPRVLAVWAKTMREQIIDTKIIYQA